MKPEDSKVPPSISQKALWAEKRRMRWLDRFPGNPLVHLLVFSRWFRCVAVAILLLPVIAALTLPAIWVTSPPGLEPPVKVSVVDLIQAWSLQRSAVRLAAQGKDQEAARALHLALANNVADPELVRASLRHAVQSEALRQAAAANAMALIPWLLYLGRTNRADVALAAQAYDRFDLPDQALSLLRAALPEALTAEEEALNLRFLFRSGRFEEFGARWERVGLQFEGHKELSLYRTAYLAGWGPPGQMTSAAERLAEAARTPAQEILANRLQLSVFAELLDEEGYGQALARLERARADQLSDQLGLWRLLTSLGQTAKARKLADAHMARAGSAQEIVQLTEAYMSLDMVDRARAVLDHYGSQYGDFVSEWATKMWMANARLLAEARDWTGLEQLAVRLRALKRAGPALTGLSYLFEGRALAAQGLPDQAASAFARCAEFTFPDATTGLQAGHNLIELGYPDVALNVLAKFELAMGKDPNYWLAVFRAVYAVRKDADALVQAARRAHEGLPDNAVLMSNYAAALLITRQEPDEALRLTLTVIDRMSESPVARVNHAFALSLNQRFDEAETVLRLVAPASLEEQQQTAYHLGLAEAYFGRRQFQQADRELNLVQPKYLFPMQIQRVEQLKAEASAASGG